MNDENTQKVFIYISAIYEVGEWNDLLLRSHLFFRIEILGPLILWSGTIWLRTPDRGISQHVFIR